MDTRYYWTLCQPPDKQPIEGSQHFAAQMERAFGPFPIELNEKHIERLEGLAAAWDRPTLSPFVLLIRAIYKFPKGIRIWSESE